MAEGTRLGKRASYVYQSDDDQLIILTLDATLGDLPGSGLTRYDGSQANVCKKPIGFKPRYVRWKAVLADGSTIFKNIVCNNLAGSYYKSFAIVDITIGDDAGQTQGRVGEKYTYIRATPGGPLIGGGGGTP